MADQIVTLLDNANNKLYPQVMAGGVQGLADYALKKDLPKATTISDTGWSNEGVTFVNGAKNNGTRSAYRMITIGSIKIVMLNLLFSLTKDAPTNFIQVVKFPSTVIIGNGATHYIKTEVHDGVQLRFSTSGLELKATKGLSAGRNVYFETMYFV